MRNLTTTYRYTVFLINASLLFCYPSVAQIDSTQSQIQVLARPSMDSIVLRWAPTNVETWINANRDGYEVQRYTLVRDGQIVNPPEKTVLSQSLIKPWPEARWEPIVSQDRYAAIAAQALFGSEFELTTEGTDVFQIVNKVQENKMRFSFALYAADLSVQVSLALGLRITDKDVHKDEKYLYRIVSIHEQDTIHGSVFVGPEEYELPQPLDFVAEFSGGVVSLKWDQSYHRGIYTAYMVERSEDGKVFSPISDEAVVTLSSEDKPESRYQYATDSLPNVQQEFWYRVKGLTPFGEWGPPTEAIAGRGAVEVSDVPYIVKDDSPDNIQINLQWEFPSESEAGLKGFDVRRAPSPRSRLISVNPELLPAASRSYTDLTAEKNNYYQVVAITQAGAEIKSPVHYAQLIDSIPPLPPVNLTGEVNVDGTVSFQWQANGEPDIYGYRVYRSNNKRAEFSQVTVEPIGSTSFADSVDLRTLDRHIYYQVMAIDKSQNHSDLSQILELELPDLVPPVAPVFLPASSSKEGIDLQWLPSSSDDVVRYHVYLRASTESMWSLVDSVVHTQDTVVRYRVTNVEEGVRNSFTVVAIDAAGLESPPANPIIASRLITAIKPPVVVVEPEVDREERQVKLKWTYAERGVAKYQIYRMREGEDTKLYSTVDGRKLDFVDRQLVMNSVYTYQVVALFSSGSRSAFSEKIIVNY